MVVLVIPGSHSERAPEDVAEPIILDEPVAPATSSLRETWSSEGAVGVLAALIRKMVGSSALKRQVSIATHPGRIACHTLKHITAVVSPCCPNIGIWLADKWASPLLYHPAQESSISAMIWGPLSDTLYVATLEGVLIWSLRFHGLRSMEQAWCLRCDSLPSPLASSLTVSPFGRVFVASSEESTSVTVWDGITSDPVPVSCSGEASGGTVTCMAWAPLGLHILIGFRSGSIALLSTTSWRLDGNDTFELPASIRQISWISPTTALICCGASSDGPGGLDVYTYTLRYEPSDEPFSRDTDGGAYITGSQMCSVPLRLDPKPFLHSLKSIGLVAVSVACKPSNSKRSGDINTDDVDDPVDGDLILPVVAVYSAALSPSLSLVLLRTVQLTSSEYTFDETTLHLFEPRQFAFRQAELRGTSSSSALGSLAGSHVGLPSSQQPAMKPRTPSRPLRMVVEASAAAESRALTQAPGGVLSVVWGSGATTIDAVSLGVASRW